MLNQQHVKFNQSRACFASKSSCSVAFEEKRSNLGLQLKRRRCAHSVANAPEATRRGPHYNPDLMGDTAGEIFGIGNTAASARGRYVVD